ncbi:MAG: tetratricopeptide repeat protein, partial [Planctomycetes bacterium]|nr:tetratricopeptide repeat protein [Planctomycetota bacterium]
MTRHRTSRGWPLLFGFLLALQILSADAASVAQENDAKAAATRDYAVALGFQKKKLYEPAATRWANFLKTYPGDERVANVHYHLGVCRFRLKQLPEALAEFTTVVTKHPQSQYADAAQFNLGLVRYNQALESKKPEDFQQAAAQFAAVPAKFAQSPNVPAALYYQGECLVQGGDAKAAVEVYRKLLAGHPNSELMPDAHYALATTQQQLEQHADAAATLTAFLQKFAQHELAPECRLRLGMAQLGQEKFAEAEQTLAAAAAIKDFPLADFALLERGRALVGLKREADAAAVYESIPKQLPESQYVGPALLAAGKSRFRAGQFPEADADFAALVAHPKKLPQAPEAAYWRGRALVEQKKPADAVQVYDQALAGYPQSEHRPDLIFGRIDALYEQPAQRPQTVGLYAEFAAQHAEHEKAPRALYRAALTALELADHAAGRKHADAFLANAKYVQHEVAPDVVYVGAECAVRGEQPDFARGETLFRQLLSRWPEHRYVPQARIGVGFCLHGAAKHDEAVAWLNQQVGALKEPAHQAEARYLMGLSHHAAGRPKEAVPAFRAALAANPQAPNADEMLYALALSLRADAQPEPAAAELAKLAANHKQSAWRDEALFALGDIAHERGQHDAAATHFRQLVAEHAQSELAPQAQYR